MPAKPTTTVLNSPNLRQLLANQSGQKGAVNLASFLDDQKRYARAYATEGRHLAASWNYEEGPAAHSDTPLQSGFDTPILKPRVRPATLIHDAPATLKDDRHDHEEVSVEKSMRNWRACQTKVADQQTSLHAKEAAATGREQRSTTKRRTKSSSDAENAARELHLGLYSESCAHCPSGLADRRERKRTRREIMKPLPVEDEDEDPSADGDDDDDRGGGRRSSRRNKSQAKKTRKPKLPAGLSLMQGFIATNVGKSRLTVCSYPLAQSSYAHTGDHRERLQRECSVRAKHPIKSMSRRSLSQRQVSLGGMVTDRR